MRGRLHSYSSDTKDRRLVHVYLALISILLAYALFATCKKFQIKIPWWVDAPSVLGLYGIIYFLHKKILWKMAFFRTIFSIKTPDWNGKYSCYLKTSFDNFTSEKELALQIIQDWDSITVVTKSDFSNSTSLSGAFSVGDSVSPVFTYEYLNQPNHDAPESMNIHKGMASIWFEDSCLKGEFFNGRGRNTYGIFQTKLGL